MTYYEHYFRLFRKIDSRPRWWFASRWHVMTKEDHLADMYVIAVCIGAGYVAVRGDNDMLRVTRKGRKLCSLARQ